MWHHALGAIVFYETLLYMDFCVVYGTMLLFTEVSTIFTSARYFLYTHDLGTSNYYYANGIILFFVFLIGRLYYQVYITFALGVPYLVKESELGKIEPLSYFVILQMACIVVGSLVLNFYWFYLMCKMIARILKRLIWPKNENEESIELVRAD